MQSTAWLALIPFLAICLGVGGLGAIVTEKGVRTWYPTLRKPPGTPPQWVFGPVWTTLYVLMAVSAWLVWRDYRWGARAALFIFLAQLALNVAWSGIFFRARRPGFALFEILISGWRYSSPSSSSIPSMQSRRACCFRICCG